jgi:UDP-N-acetylglucosamine--N-acetylmuramyl-(pentapeptide) pyrophosphoryl-undecaprenol N-acetylglucosamine transferase
VGIPLRREISTLDRLGVGDKARAHFGLRSDLPTLLVFGGSQGARSLNRAVGEAVPALRAAGIQILHIVGPKNATEPEVTADDPAYITLPYCDRMDLAYAAADFAMCRAGAMTCAELTAVGLPAAYVPLPIGNGEQLLNAEPIVAGRGGLLVEDGELSPDWIRTNVLPVLGDAERVAQMSEAAARMGRRDADVALARMVTRVVAAARTAGTA